MTFFQITKLNSRKLKFYPGKALFLIIPVAFIVAASIVITSQVRNFKDATDKSVFGTVDEVGKLIKVSKNSTSFTQGGGGGRITFSANGGFEQFTETDLDKVTALENVVTASINTTVPVQNATIKDLFSEGSVSASSLVGINSELAGLYTDSSFEYKEGEAIPIILNANALMRTYEDWGDKTEVTLDLTSLRRNVESGATPQTALSNTDSPIKTEAISYDKNDLIGKEFTMTFGGLESIQDYSTAGSESGITFTKYTDDEMTAKEAARKELISQYWDYTKISTPIQYKFVVVGVIEDEGTFESYIPEAFGNKVMSDLIQNQLSARTSTELTTDIINANFQGLNYDGVELSSGGTGPGRMIGIRLGGIGRNDSSSSNDSVTYTIPGLVLQTERSSDTGNPFANQADATGILTDTTVFEKATKSGSTMLIKIDSIYNRTSVVEQINDLGFAYQDLYKSDVFNELKDTLNTITTILPIIFIVFAVVVVMFTLGKFVSESKKEIGIFRALGATRGDIRNLFVSQAVLYTLVGYVIGTVGGLALTILTSPAVESWFNSFITRTVKESFGISISPDAQVFARINWESFAIYSGILLVVTVLISLIPATRASRISPVEAIRGE